MRPILSPRITDVGSAAKVLPTNDSPQGGPLTLFAWLALAASLAWAYGGSMLELAERWRIDPAYSHGFLVPLFSAYLLWHRRGVRPKAEGRGAWLGLAALFVAAAMLLAAAWWYYVVLAPYSLLPCLAGVCLLAGGWPLLRWTWPAIAFLVFMVPLPGRFEDMLGEPLQRAATIASTYAVQTLGVPAFAEGNVIVLSEAKIGVVEACSGLRMLILFFAISTAVAFLARRPLWERLMIVAGSVPIALTANVVRITATAAVYEWGNRAFAEKVFHDLSGWLMMPFALLLATLELWVLSHLFVPSKAAGPVALATIEVAPPRIPKPAPTPASDEKREEPGWRKRRRSTAKRS